MSKRTASSPTLITVTRKLSVRREARNCVAGPGPRSCSRSRWLRNVVSAITQPFGACSKVCGAILRRALIRSELMLSWPPEAAARIGSSRYVREAFAGQFLLFEPLISRLRQCDGCRCHIYRHYTDGGYVQFLHVTNTPSVLIVRQRPASHRNVRDHLLIYLYNKIPLSMKLIEPGWTGSPRSNIPSKAVTQAPSCSEYPSLKMLGFAARG